METEDRAMNTVCDHSFEIRIRGGEPISVRMCTYCHEPDWADLKEQAKRLYDDGYLDGQHRTAEAILRDRPEPSAEERRRVTEELARYGIEPGVPAVQG